VKVRFDQSTNCCGRDRKRSLPWQPALVPHARHFRESGALWVRTYLSKLEKGASYPGLEIISKLTTVLEVEPAELLRVPMPKGNRESCRYRSN
jgi:hypothetical protein